MSDTTTANAPPGWADHYRGLRLVVVADGTVATHPLPDDGCVVVGRTGSADVRIDLPQVSRRHVRLSLGSVVTVEDLGSANGTRVRGRTAPSGAIIEVEPGDSIELGSALLVIQRQPPAEPRSRVWSHDRFEAHLQDQCARARRRDGRFAVSRIRTAAAPEPLRDALLEIVGADGAIATYAPRVFEIFVPGASKVEAERVIGRAWSRLGGMAASCRATTACYPGDGLTACELLEKLITDPASGLDRDVGCTVMQHLSRLLERVAFGEINVLLTGETGVGKELLAERIHRLSRRADGPLVKLNCAAFPDSLLESELFGHERGAFTGANRAKPGLLEVAGGGTVFLDEVGDLPPSAQAKLLRVLEDRRVLRVGGLDPRRIDVRFVAATHRDLENGPFRRDLYFRLAGVTIRVPPLRERTDEIERLARGFVRVAADGLGIDAPEIGPGALALLLRYAWPGNVRELRNVMERAVLLCDSNEIATEHLPLEKMACTGSAELGGRPGDPSRDASEDSDGPGKMKASAEDLRSGRDAVERRMVLDALGRAGGNQTAAARLLGISRRALINRLIKFDLPRPRKKR